MLRPQKIDFSLNVNECVEKPDTWWGYFIDILPHETSLFCFCELRSNTSRHLENIKPIFIDWNTSVFFRLIQSSCLGFISFNILLEEKLVVHQVFMCKWIFILTANNCIAPDVLSTFTHSRRSTIYWSLIIPFYKRVCTIEQAQNTPRFLCCYMKPVSSSVIAPLNSCSPVITYRV